MRYGIGALVLFAVLLGGCRSAHVAPDAQVIEVTDVHRTFAAMAAPGAPREVRPGQYVIHVPAGTRLTLAVELQTPFCHTERAAAPAQLVFDRATWLALGDPIQVSFDGTTWQPLTGGGKSTLSVGVSQSAPDAQPEARLAYRVR
jgi:hypothetical protein